MTGIFPNGYGVCIHLNEVTIMTVDKHGKIQPCYNPPNGHLVSTRNLDDVQVKRLLKKIRKFKPVGVSCHAYRGPEKWR